MHWKVIKSSLFTKTFYFIMDRMEIGLTPNPHGMTLKQPTDRHIRPSAFSFYLFCDSSFHPETTLSITV